MISALGGSRWNLPNPLRRRLQRISDAAGASIILILSDINMPGMSGLEMLPKAKAIRPDVPSDHDHRLRRRGDQTEGAGEWCRSSSD